MRHKRKMVKIVHLPKVLISILFVCKIVSHVRGPNFVRELDAPLIFSASTKSITPKSIRYMDNIQMLMAIYGRSNRNTQKGSNQANGHKKLTTPLLPQSEYVNV